MKKAKAKIERTPVVPMTKFDRFTAIETTIDNLIQQSLDYSASGNLGPLVTGDLLVKLVTAHERMLNIEKMKRENMESINGTSRRIIFDWTITAPREPGNPDEPNG